MKKITLSGIIFLAVLFISVCFIYQSCTPDPCKDVVCNNDGTCTDGKCACPAGYEGAVCDTLSRAKILKVWTSVTNSCCAGCPTWQVTALEYPDDNRKFKLKKFGHLACPSGTIIVNCTMTGANTFTIDNQTVCGITFAGNGTWNSPTSMTVAYTYFDTAGSAGSGSCSETYN